MGVAKLNSHVFKFPVMPSICEFPVGKSPIVMPSIWEFPVGKSPRTMPVYGSSLLVSHQGQCLCMGVPCW